MFYLWLSTKGDTGHCVGGGEMHEKCKARLRTGPTKIQIKKNDLKKR